MNQLEERLLPYLAKMLSSLPMGVFLKVISVDWDGFAKSCFVMLQTTNSDCAISLLRACSNARINHKEVGW